MNKVTKINKAAFIARVNKAVEPRHAIRAVVVDTYYKRVTGAGCFLMLVYADGTQKQFVGLRAQYNHAGIRGA